MSQTSHLLIIWHHRWFCTHHLFYLFEFAWWPSLVPTISGLFRFVFETLQTLNPEMELLLTTMNGPSPLTATVYAEDLPGACTGPGL